MKTEKLILKSIVILAALVCFIGFSTVKASAVSETGREDYEIMSGVTESTVYVTDSGKRNVRVHILRIQNGAEVAMKATYKGYYGKGTTAQSRRAYAASWNEDKYGYQRLRDQAKAYNASADAEGIVIAASNGDFYKDVGVPVGNFIMEGNVIKASDKEPFFAVLENGKYVIRDKDGDISDCVEAIAGSCYLVKNGEIAQEQGGSREPRQAIGICSDGTVTIINVDGREPSSPGVTLYDLANILLQQGCTDAINFDGGGSATFLTMREGDDALKFRNTPGDGFERNVSASLLVVKKNKAERKTKTGSPTVSMKTDEAVFAKDSDGLYTYEIGGKGQSGFYAINGESYYFSKGEGQSEVIRIGNVDYTFEKGRLTEVSDPDAGRVVIGYCGAAPNGGRNLLFAYQHGNDVLNIGLNPVRSGNNGRMKNWVGNKRLTLPWYSLRSDIKKVYVGDGVTTIGMRFLYVATSKIFDGSLAPEGELTAVRLPDSLRYIGDRAFMNKPKLKTIYIPGSVRYVAEDAFKSTPIKKVVYKGDRKAWKEIVWEGKPKVKMVTFRALTA